MKDSATEKQEEDEEYVRQLFFMSRKLPGQDTLERMTRIGRKKRKHPKTDKMLEHEVDKDHFITAVELKDMYANVFGEVSV